MSEPLLQRIVDEIEAGGPIGFGRYIELALYDAECGFYASGGAGRRRDFMTSPEVGPLFGAVVAGALDSWWEQLGRPDPFRFIDVGAGPGTLARAVLAATPRCGPALEYIAVEVSAAQRAGHPDSIVSVADMPEQIDRGVVFANELLDNLPFDLLEHRPGAGWFEILVAVAGGRLVETSRAAAGHVPRVVGTPTEPVRVPDHHGARRWLADALARVDRGKVVVIDYAIPGYPVAPDRDWLRTYGGHQRGTAPLDDPGAQDITIDVAIDQLNSVAAPSTVHTQAEWLRSHGIERLVDEGRAYWAAHAAAPDLAALTARSRVGEAAALLDPDGLGGFTVLEWDLGHSSRGR